MEKLGSVCAVALLFCVGGAWAMQCLGKDQQRVETCKPHQQACRYDGGCVEVGECRPEGGICCHKSRCNLVLCSGKKRYCFRRWGCSATNSCKRLVCADWSVFNNEWDYTTCEQRSGCSPNGGCGVGGSGDCFHELCNSPHRTGVGAALPAGVASGAEPDLSNAKASTPAVAVERERATTTPTGDASHGDSRPARNSGNNSSGGKPQFLGDLSNNTVEDSSTKTVVDCENRTGEAKLPSTQCNTCKEPNGEICEAPLRTAPYVNLTGLGGKICDKDLAGASVKELEAEAEALAAQIQMGIGEKFILLCLLPFQVGQGGRSRRDVSAVLAGVSPGKIDGEHEAGEGGESPGDGGGISGSGGAVGLDLNLARKDNQPLDEADAEDIRKMLNERAKIHATVGFQTPEAPVCDGAEKTSVGGALPLLLFLVAALL